MKGTRRDFIRKTTALATGTAIGALTLDKLYGASKNPSWSDLARLTGGDFMRTYRLHVLVRPLPDQDKKEDKSYQEFRNRNAMKDSCKREIVGRWAENGMKDLRALLAQFSFHEEDRRRLTAEVHRMKRWLIEAKAQNT